MLRDEKLRALSVLPLLISLIAGSALTIAGLFGLAQVISSLAIGIGSAVDFEPGGAAMIVLTILLWPFGLLALGVTVYVFIRILAAPFYSYLAERALVTLGTRTESSFSLRTSHKWLWMTLRLFMTSLLKAVLFAIAGVVLLIFSMAPFLNIVVALGYMHMVAFDISDYSFEAMGWTLRQRFQHVRDHAMTYTGLACGLGLAMAIPGLNLILLPAAVVGASETLHRTLGATRERQ